MAKNFGPGILGSVVLIDPATGLPYKAEGGGGGGSANAVRSDATDTHAYMGTAPSGSDPATDDWNITRITLTDPNNPKHAVGPWNDRATLTYA